MKQVLKWSRFFFVFILCSGLVATAAPKQKEAEAEDESVYEETLISLHPELHRLAGQSSFVEAAPVRFYGYAKSMRAGARAASSFTNESALGGAPEALMMAADAPGGADRGGAVQSDVWVDGPVAADGSRVRYLADEQQGLLVVRAGSQDRAPQFRRIPLGYAPKKLLIFPAENKLILIEQSVREKRIRDHEAPGLSRTTNAFRVVTFDITTAEQPVLKHVSEQNGIAVDAFQVGKVIYTVVKDADAKGSTEVQSYCLGCAHNRAGQPEDLVMNKVSGLVLKSKVTDEEPLQIVREPQADGTIKYYAVAVTSNSLQNDSAGGRQPVVTADVEHPVPGDISNIEVLDVSSDKGYMGESVTFVAQGKVERPGWIGISGGRVVVASSVHGRGFAPRMAIEIFKLIEADGKRVTRISAAEMNFFLYAVGNNYELVKTGTGANGEPTREEISKSAILQKLYGGHVAIDGSTKALLPLSSDRQTYASSNDQPMQVLDLKFLGDRIVLSTHGKLVSFLVDNKAPAETAVKFENAFPMEGSIYRLFPVMHAGNRYLLALGTFREPLNNPKGAKQVRLQMFSLQGEALHPVGMPLNLPASVNVDMNKAGLNYFIHTSEKGESFVALEANFRDESGVFKPGAQIVKVDLAKQDGEVTPVLGQKLLGKGFTLSRFMAGDPVGVGSDSSLVHFRGLKATALGDASSSDFNNQQIIELSRQFHGSAELDGSSFVQIVDASHTDPEMSRSPHMVSLRLTSTAKAEAHLDEVQEVLVEGTYEGHAVVANPVSGKPTLVLVTMGIQNVPESGSTRQRIHHDVSVWTTGKGGLSRDSFTTFVSDRKPKSVQTEEWKHVNHGTNVITESFDEAEALLTDEEETQPALEHYISYEPAAGKMLLPVGKGMLLMHDRRANSFVTITLGEELKVQTGIQLEGLDTIVRQIQKQNSDVNAKLENVQWSVRDLSSNAQRPALYATFSLPVQWSAQAPKAEEHVNFAYSRNFIVPLELDFSKIGELQLRASGNAINVPGRVISVLEPLPGQRAIVSEDVELPYLGVARKTNDGQMIVSGAVTGSRLIGLNVIQDKDTALSKAYVSVTTETPKGLRIPLGHDNLAFVDLKNEEFTFVSATNQGVRKLKMSAQVVSSLRGASVANSLEEQRDAQLELLQTALVPLAADGEHSEVHMPVAMIRVAGTGTLVPLAFPSSATSTSWPGYKMPMVLASATPEASGPAASSALLSPVTSVAGKVLDGYFTAGLHRSESGIATDLGNGKSQVYLHTSGPSRICTVVLSGPKAKLPEAKK